MITPAPDDVRLDAVTHISFTQMVISSGLSEVELTELVRYGALVPEDPQSPAWTFDAHWLMVARTASRLRRELDLDTHGVSVVLSYLDRIEALEAELRALRARLG
ncbi:MAG: chaperone-modulator protein CbpM [Burkholderiales bacterium]|nr:chaperone-modulator protein CbpM [Burkholderiales bacterium]